jgi:hypothetical protein
MKRSDKIIRLVIFGALLAALPLISGCREEEQGRTLFYPQGAYVGQPDQKLSQAQQQALRARVHDQTF